MIPWQELGRADIPGESQPLVLVQRGHEFVVRRGTVPLMASGQHHSEERLAESGCAAAATLAAPRVLVGGLGLGYTLAAALRILPEHADVVVGELFEPVVEWNRGPLSHLAGHPMRDPRVRVELGDVRDTIVRESPWDAILLDVDNGPDGFTRRDNAALYSSEGLVEARKALAPRGVLAVWSVAPDDAFVRRFARAGFTVQEQRVSARANGKGGTHVLWFGTRH
jgi:spermidine synthase